MAYEITKRFVVEAPAADVWAFLVDPRRVARCMPGAAVTEQLDEKTWAGTMTVKVGPVQASYRGKVVLERLDPAARTAEIAATGQDVRGKGGADLRLTSRLAERAPRETEVTAVSAVNVSGLLAQMGRGMIDDVADQLFQTFSQRMRAEIEAPAQGASAGATPASAPQEKVAARAAPLAAAASPPPAIAAASGGVAAASAPEPLDLGALGAGAAGRAAARFLARPTPLWLSLVLAAAVLYVLLSR